VSVFKEITFASSYIARRRNSNSPGACNRPDCQIGGGKLLYEFIDKNKFRKIIDFGTWGGGSVICAAQALQKSSAASNRTLKFDLYDQGYSALVTDAMTAINKNDTWKLHDEVAIPDLIGEIKVFDKFWDNEGQNGNMEAVLRNLQEHQCYQNIQFTFRKVDMWDWLKNPEPFDLLHVDIHNTSEKILTIVHALEEQINAGAVVLFVGGALRFSHAPFGQCINEDGVDVSHVMTSLGDPDNYRRLKATGLDFTILTQEYPGIICIDRRARETLVWEQL